jgi:hypothetical protein
MIKQNVSTDKSLRLDLSEFNASLVEMLCFIKEKNINFQNIIQNECEPRVSSAAEVVKKEEEVDLSKLKLNIQALKDAVQIAKKQKKDKK